MSLTAGAISLVQNSPTSPKLAATAATGGTGPYTQQWYRSQTSGFTPGGGNIIAGATALTLSDSGLVPGSLYYYKVVYTDTGASNVTVTATQLAVTSLPPVQQPNQFAQSEQLGMIDLRFDYNTVAVQIDATQATALYAGAAVKIVDSAGGIPKVVGCAANSDEVLGFINYDVKSVTFIAGSNAEISMAGNVIYLYATAAIARGARVQLDLNTNGGVGPLAADGSDIVGWAFDKASAAGDLIRVFVLTPSFAKSA
jgi:hypothetical protein